MFNIAYNVVCAPNNSVLPYLQTLTYRERAELIPKLKMILMYCVKYRKAECWFFFSVKYLHSCKNGSQMKNNPDSFCYNYGNMVLPNCQTKLTNFVKKLYCYYFGVKVEHQDNPFAPYICKLDEWRTWGIGGMVKGRVCHLPFHWSRGKENSHYGLSSLNLKGKKIAKTSSMSFRHKTNPSWPRPSCSWARL